MSVGAEQIEIRPLAPDDVDAVVALAVRAWAPVFAGIEAELGARDGVVAGFVILEWIEEDASPAGEVQMIAVDPDAQRTGVAGRLMARAIEVMQARGVPLAVVATGGDRGHAPARALYERLGFRPLPLTRYYRPL